MCGNAAHRMNCDGTAEHRLMTTPVGICPGLLQHDRLVEGDLGDLSGDTTDRRGRHAALRGDRLGSVFGGEITLCHQGKGRKCRPPVGERMPAEQVRIDVGGLGGGEHLRRAVPGKRSTFRVAREEAVISSTRRLDDEVVRVGVADQEFRIDLAALEQAMDEGKNEQSVGTRRDADELATLAQAVPTEVDQTTKGVLPKDLNDKLKRIEKSAKQLRSRISQ